MQEDIIRWFQAHSSPLLDRFFEISTIFGEQYVVIAIAGLIYWNISKRQGFYLSYIYLFSVAANMILKISFQTKRPFQTLENISGKRLHTATGYSFPSGHTQGATSFYWILANITKRQWFYGIAILIVLLVGISRMYLGVHWPIDVFGGWFFGILIAIILTKVLDKLYDNKEKLLQFVYWSAFFIVLLTAFSQAINLLYFEGEMLISDLFKVSGIVLGVSIGFGIELKHVNFNTTGSFSMKTIRYLLGILTTVLILVGLKKAFSYLPDCLLLLSLRYFIVGFWLIVGFPYLGMKIKLFE